MSLEFGFTPLNEHKPWVKLLLYGPAGSGKTRFTADAPEPYWFDFENSTETLRYYPEFRDTPVKKGRAVLDIQNDVRRMAKDGKDRTVVIDSMTSCHSGYLREHVLKTRPKNPYESDWRDHQYVTQVFTDLFGFLADAPINVVLIGHQRTKRSEQGTILGIWPDITPKLQDVVTRLVNVVAYYEEKPGQDKRLMYLKRTPIIEAKNRLSIVKSPVENPTWKELFTDLTEIPFDEYTEPEAEQE